MLLHWLFYNFQSYMMINTYCMHYIVLHWFSNILSILNWIEIIFFLVNKNGLYKRKLWYSCKSIISYLVVHIMYNDPIAVHMTHTHTCIHYYQPLLSFTISTSSFLGESSNLITIGERMWSMNHTQEKSVTLNAIVIVYIGHVTVCVLYFLLVLL